MGDRIFVSKYTYGFSKHSLPFSPGILNERIFYKKPKQGDLVVFKTPVDNRTDYIKRLIGLPGDEIQFIEGNIFINDKKAICINPLFSPKLLSKIRITKFFPFFDLLSFPKKVLKNLLLSHDRS